MPTSICTSSYECDPIWFDKDNDGTTKPMVIIPLGGPHTVDVNLVVIPKTGQVVFQVEDENGNWFTPQETTYTIIESTIVRLPRANMPRTRVMATLDATFRVVGSLTLEDS